MAGWSGHRAGTRRALLDLLTTAQFGSTRFSEAQRALFTACEFWAAFQNLSLPEYLSTDIESSLSAAEAAFSAIRLPVTAAVLRSMRARFPVEAPASTQGLIHELENALSEIDEPVDLALERFAYRMTEAD